MSEIPTILHQVLAGRYLLKREIGRGGAATVYLAHDVRHERLVAIKVLHPELSHALGAQRFLREIKLTASLQHPHILPIHDSGEADDRLFYVMPYVEGESLRQRLGADNRLSVEETVRIGREVAGALAYAHEHGIVHRDIKPENILFSGGHAVLADFGIARAINRASEKITHQGTITGTPAYMSPEQARDRAFDGRSDVYSLSCVLYESIAGVPPYVGDTPHQLLAQRISKAPPLLSEYRHDVPKPIESVIARALSIAPEDRYDDARAFSAALSVAIGNSGETRPEQTRRRAVSRNPWLWAAGVALLVAGGAATTPDGRDRLDLLRGSVDTSRYAVIPFQYVGAPSPASDMEPAASGTYDALRRWDGLPLVSEMSVSDAVRSRHDVPLSVEEISRIARHLRAGRVVWGRVRIASDSLVVRAVLYDALTGQNLREVTRVVPAGSLRALQQVDFRSLAADLLRDTRGAALSPGADRGTTSYVAWKEFERAADAMDHWDLRVATKLLEQATAADPSYAQAQLWLAQARFLRGAEPKEWNAPLISAQRGRSRLDVREQTVADALTKLSRSDLPGACGAYGAMRTRDSLDAMAWISLALCSAQDQTIIPLNRSGTRVAFRTSPEVVWTAVSRGLELAPEAFGVFPYAKLGRYFPMEHNIMRLGNMGETMFAAWPELVGDSVAYAAAPVARLSTLAVPLSNEAALRFNRDRMLGLLEGLTRRLPESPDAFEALTSLLESRDEISGTPSGRYSALSALDRARMLAVDPAQKLRLTIDDMRLHLKLGDFARSAAIADSLLRANPSPTSAQAVALKGVAAYAGRTGLAAQLDRLGDAPDAHIPNFGPPAIPAADDAVAALLMRTALGVCDDSVKVLVSSIDRTLASYSGSAERPALRQQLLERPLMLAGPCLSGRWSLELPTSTIPMVRLERLIATGDLAASRRTMDSITLARRTMRPGAMSLDHVMLESWAREASGDRRGAADRIDLSLSALPTLSPSVLYDPVLAASIGRIMAYRADLAQRLNDPATAAMWAGRVLTLWAHADANLEPTMRRMRMLAAHHHAP